MANRFEVSVDVSVPAERAWEVVGDPADMRWFAPVESCRVEGDTRYADMAGGARLVERILDHDDSARSYSYSVLEGTPTKLRSHRASLRVEETGSGCRITWRTEAKPEDPEVDLERWLSGVMQAALEELKRLLEDRPV